MSTDVIFNIVVKPDGVAMGGSDTSSLGFHNASALGSAPGPLNLMADGDSLSVGAPKPMDFMVSSGSAMSPPQPFDLAAFSGGTAGSSDAPSPTELMRSASMSGVDNSDAPSPMLALIPWAGEAGGAPMPANLTGFSNAGSPPEPLELAELESFKKSGNQDSKRSTRG